MNHLSSSLKKLGETFCLQKELLKQEMNHTEIYEDTWMDKKDELVTVFENGCVIVGFYICKIYNEYGTDY